MNLKGKILLAANILECSILKNRKPLFVGWRLTNRCNLKCKYCKLPKDKTELSTNEIFSVIDEMAKMGCKRINYTGGEPLIREDIGRIISYTKNKGISATMTTNGTLISKRINEISGLERITISLDGPELINKLTRKSNLANNLIKIVKVIKTKGIKVNISCVLTKYNVNYIREIIAFTKNADIYISFQPVADYFYDFEDINDLFPKKKEYDKAIEYLITLKKQKEKISNSIPGLQHLSHWPNNKSIGCAAGIIRCRIEANGEVYPCNRIKNKPDYKNLREVGIRKAFEDMLRPKCDGCWCANHVEMNLIYELNKDAILNSMKTQG